MHVLYADGVACNVPALKRLLLVADQIAFTDRASVVFKDWGLIGVESPMRRVVT